MSGATASPKGQALRVQRRSWGQAAPPSLTVHCGRRWGWAGLRLRAARAALSWKRRRLPRGPRWTRGLCSQTGLTPLWKDCWPL